MPPAVAARLELDDAIKNKWIELAWSQSSPLGEYSIACTGETLCRGHRSSVSSSRSNWPGLIIEVPEEQIVGDLTLAGEMSKKLEPYNVRLAIDNCGRTVPSLAKADELPFEQLKLDPSFVAD